MLIGAGQQLSVVLAEKYPPSFEDIGEDHSV
jgi:hypothetical protein